VENETITLNELSKIQSDFLLSFNHLQKMNVTMFRKCSLILLPLLLSLSSHAQEPQSCAVTISELRVILGDQAFPLKWEETTMKDGKPLLVTIFEKKNLLFLQFIKAREGLWAESAGVICKTSVGLEIQFSGEHIRLGPAANWVLRYALGNGGKFTLTKLGSEKLRITTIGWSGMFSPRNE
jgi:hypothetical protein